MPTSPSDVFVESIGDAAAEFIHASGLGLTEEGQAAVVQPLILLAWAIMKTHPGMTPESFGRLLGAAGEVLAERDLASKVLRS